MLQNNIKNIINNNAMYFFLERYWQSLMDFIQLLISNLTNYRVNDIRRKDKINSLLTSIIKYSYYTSVDENNRPLGLIISFSKLYIGYVYYIQRRDGSDDHAIRIFCNSDYINKITQISKINVKQEITQISKINVKHKFIKYISGYGRFTNRHYRIEKSPYNFIMYNDQKKMINEMLKIYEEKEFLTSYLYGKIGVGKTELGHILANILDSYICNNFDPSIPGETLLNLYTSVHKEKGKPLIIIIDEFDILIKKVHNSEIKPHRDVDTLIKNKQSWNNFLDDIARKRFPFLILILTSNSYPNDINKMDPCYLREGRVHYSKEVLGKKFV